MGQRGQQFSGWLTKLLFFGGTSYLKLRGPPALQGHDKP